jgi:hypothetical protein
VTVARAQSTPEGASTGGGGAGGGADSDAAYLELLRRLHQEQEQLGQLIQHPF